MQNQVCQLTLCSAPVVAIAAVSVCIRLHHNISNTDCKRASEEPQAAVKALSQFRPMIGAEACPERRCVGKVHKELQAAANALPADHGRQANPRSIMLHWLP